MNTNPVKVNTTPNKPKKVARTTLPKEEVKKLPVVANVGLWAVTAAIVGAVSFFNVQFADQYNAIVRLLVVVAAVVLALGSFVLTNQGRAFLRFTRESLLELRKIYWPTRKEALNTSLVVVAVSVITSFAFWFLDSIIHTVVELITTWRF